MPTSSITKKFKIKDDEACNKLIEVLTEDKPKRRKKPSSNKYEEGKRLLKQHASGILSKYANPESISEERETFENALVERHSESMRNQCIDYRKKAKQLDITYSHLGDEIKGHMNGKTSKEVVEYFERIKKCTCGGEPRVIQSEGMGEVDTTIMCTKCGRIVEQSDYDREYPDDPGCEELALIKWNAGMTQEEIERLKKEAWEKKRLREEDLEWLPLYPNNMPENGVEGMYCLLFMKNENGTIYCCKWTIQYQREEKEPLFHSYNAPVEAYILFMKRYFDVKGPLRYPDPKRAAGDCWTDLKSGNTFTHSGVNDAGDFERAYKTLEEAKAGALARCGWQGLNKETILKQK